MRMVVFLVGAAAPVVLLGMRLAGKRVLHQRFWQVLVVGVGTNAAAAITGYLAPESGLERFRWLLDAAFALSYVLYAAFIVAVLQRRAPAAAEMHRTRWLVLVDAGIVACAGTAVLWPVVLRPAIIDHGREGFEVAGRIASALLVVLLFGLASQLFERRRRLHGDEILMLVWILSVLAAELVYDMSGAILRFHGPAPVVHSWLLSSAVLAALASHPRLTATRADRDKVARASELRSWALLPVVLVPLAVQFVLRSRGGGVLTWVDRTALTALLVALVCLVFARMNLLSGDLVEQHRLADELAAVSRRLHDLATRDPLTGLLNRPPLFERLEHALRQRRRTPTAATAVVVLDLDGFKAINDTLGHDHGDAVLVEVASRLRACLRPGDTLGRFGGDEFVVVLEQVDRAGAASTATRIIESLGAPITAHGQEVTVSASVGIALAGPGTAAAQGLKEADAAMYEAKRGGGGRYAFAPCVPDGAITHTPMVRARRIGRADGPATSEPLSRLHRSLPAETDALETTA
jgi:diguanylate cyclase (GGDEF)-like protein